MPLNVQEELNMTMRSDTGQGGLTRRALLRFALVGAAGVLGVSACATAALSTDGQTATCKDLWSSVLKAPGTVPFLSTYASPDLNGAVARKDELVGRLNLQ